MSSGPSDAEIAVKRYLMYLDGSDALVDEARVVQLEQRAASTLDPLERLKVLADLVRARHPDVAVLREEFHLHAKRWAEMNGVPPEAFAAYGVPDDDLRAAGLALRASTPLRAVGGRPEGRGVTVGEITRQILSTSTPFTLADITRLSGGSLMTVRKAVRGLVQRGDLACIGPDPDHARPGRAPLRFRRTAPAAAPVPAAPRRGGAGASVRRLDR